MEKGRVVASRGWQHGQSRCGLFAVSASIYGGCEPSCKHCAFIDIACESKQRFCAHGFESPWSYHLVYLLLFSKAWTSECRPIWGCSTSAFPSRASGDTGCCGTRWTVFVCRGKSAARPNWATSQSSSSFPPPWPHLCQRASSPRPSPSAAADCSRTARHLCYNRAYAGLSRPSSASSDSDSVPPSPRCRRYCSVWARISRVRACLHSCTRSANRLERIQWQRWRDASSTSSPRCSCA
mmetsp:Transcript_28096/g.61672  ORF Transcript_28096/g.61672 Transcript_28096/m.61672 type:complete len:238 (+) Transcript_28096:528-1241(+)